VHAKTYLGTDTQDVLVGREGFDTFIPGLGDDDIDGGTTQALGFTGHPRIDTDSIIFNIASDEVVSVTQEGETFTIVSSEGTDTVTNIEYFIFDDRVIPHYLISSLLDESSEPLDVINATIDSETLTIHAFSTDVIAYHYDGDTVTLEVGENTISASNITGLNFLDLSLLA